MSAVSLEPRTRSRAHELATSSSGIDAGTSVIKSVAFSLAGEQVAVRARPNVYQTLGGGQVEQDMARTWADCAATLARARERVPDLSSRVAAIARDGPGRRHMADRRSAASRSAAAFSGSILARPASCRTICSTDAYRDHLRAHRLGPQRVHGIGRNCAWMKRWQPERIDARRHRLSLQGLAVFQADRRARDRSVGGQCSPSATIARGNTSRRFSGHGNRRLRAAAAADRRRRQRGRAGCPPRPRPRNSACRGPAGRRSPMSTSSCTALGGGLYDPRGGVGLLHPRLDRHAHALCARRPRTCGSTTTAPAIRWLSDAARPAPDAVQHGVDDQHRLAARHGARGVLRRRATSTISRRRFLPASTTRVLARRARAGCSTIPIFLKRASAGLSSIPTRGRSSSACRPGRFRRHDARGVRRPRLRGARLLRWPCGSIPDEIRVTGGAARSKAIRAILGSALGANVRTLASARRPALRAPR